MHKGYYTACQCWSIVHDVQIFRVIVFIKCINNDKKTCVLTCANVRLYFLNIYIYIYIYIYIIIFFFRMKSSSAERDEFSVVA